MYSITQYGLPQGMKLSPYTQIVVTQYDCQGALSSETIPVCENGISAKVEITSPDVTRVLWHTMTQLSCQTLVKFWGFCTLAEIEVNNGTIPLRTPNPDPIHNPLQGHLTCQACNLQLWKDNRHWINQTSRDDIVQSSTTNSSLQTSPSCSSSSSLQSSASLGTRKRLGHHPFNVMEGSSKSSLSPEIKRVCFRPESLMQKPSSQVEALQVSDLDLLNDIITEDLSSIQTTSGSPECALNPNKIKEIVKLLAEEQSYQVSVEEPSCSTTVSNNSTPSSSSAIPPYPMTPTTQIPLIELANRTIDSIYNIFDNGQE